MTDNVTIATGVGSTTADVASDDVSGKQYQRVKIDLGGDAVSSPLIRGQDTAANSIPVVLPSDGTLPLPSGAATAANQSTGNTALAAIQTAVELIDNTVGGTELQVDVVAALPAGTNNIGDVDVASVPAPLSTTGGGLEATALRVTLASDSTGVVSIDDNAGSITVDGTVAVSGTVTVDGSGVTQPVSNAGLTELAAAINASSQMDVNIAASNATVTVDSELTTADLDTGVGTDTRAVVGLVGTASGGGQLIPGSSTDGLLVNLGTNNDVTVTSISAGDNNIGNVDIVSVPAPLSTTGGGTEATALRVTLANDSTGVVSVDDNAGSLTVDNAGLTSLNGAISGTEVQVDVVAALPAGTNAIGKLAANSGVDIGDVDVTSIAAGETHLGEVGGKTAVVSVTLSTDTAAYASGDLIADTQQIDAFFRKADGTGVINSINIIDEDAQGVALYIIFMSTTTSLGTENSAPNISDANLTAGFQGIVSVATTDYVTISGAKVATLKNIGLPVKAVSGTDDLYIAVLNSTGTPTYTAAGLEMRIGVLLD